jgi:hypothetical protein
MNQKQGKRSYPVDKHSKQLLSFRNIISILEDGIYIVYSKLQRKKSLTNRPCQHLIIALLLSGCATTSINERVSQQFAHIPDNCYFVAIEIQRQMGEGWYVVTLENARYTHAVTCGTEYCMDNGLLGGKFQESSIKKRGWNIVKIESFGYANR